MSGVGRSRRDKICQPTPGTHNCKCIIADNHGSPSYRVGYVSVDGMRDKEFYAQILGIHRPWRVADVELKLPTGEVQVFVEQKPGV